jgi:ABC-type multidrug transport system fused ATPase/permease subunit
MKEKEVIELINELKLYPKQLEKISNGKPKRKEMDYFKTYYEKVFKNLVEYIQSSKDKKLSEKAKELPVLKSLFSNFNIYMALLIVIMIGPVSLIVYLYTMSYIDLIYTIIGIDIVLIFFLVRKIQKESVVVINKLINAKLVVKEVIKIIENNIH